MRTIFRRIFRNRRPQRKEKKVGTDFPSKVENIVAELTPPMPRVSGFTCHISRYAGKTVTVFVASGGLSGFGFTGVLLYSDSIHIKLLIQPGPAPTCVFPFNQATYFNPYNYGYPVVSIGQIACIRTDKITAFVHNSL